MTRNKLSAMATRRLIRIGRLEKELAAERAITRALSKLDYAPNQNPRSLGLVKRAFTIKNQLLNQPTNDT